MHIFSVYFPPLPTLKLIMVCTHTVLAWPQPVLWKLPETISFTSRPTILEGWTQWTQHLYLGWILTQTVVKTTLPIFGAYHRITTRRNILSHVGSLPFCLE